MRAPGPEIQRHLSRKIAVCVLVPLLHFGCAGRRPPQVASRPPAVPAVHPGRPLRVAIAVEVQSLEIQARSPALLRAWPSGEVIGRFRRLALSPGTRGSIRVAPRAADARAFSDTLRVEPSPGEALAVDGKPYRGELEVFADGFGGLTVVNLVDLEEYLLGVVPLEIGSPGPDAIEAVMAQAVAARTYAVSHVGRWPEHGFDLYGDVRDQVYGGIAAEREASSKAVQETMGVVATFEGRLIRAYYSAACGGMTAAVEETWNYPPEPYLRAHRDRRGGADFCRLSKHYRWEEKWSASQFMDLLARHLPAEFGGAPPEGELTDVRVVARNSSGRVGLLVVRAGGREHRLGGDRIRWVLRRPGGGILRSSQFEIRVERRRGRVQVVIARGAGNGHGVGLCQAGAIRMAAEGFNYRQILGHYYPGIRLARLRVPGLAQGPPWRVELAVDRRALRCYHAALFQNERSLSIWP